MLLLLTVDRGVVSDYLKTSERNQGSPRLPPVIPAPAYAGAGIQTPFVPISRGPGLWFVRFEIVSEP